MVSPKLVPMGTRKDGGGGGDVKDGAAHGGGQGPGRDETAGNGLNQLLFRALGVPGGQNDNLNIVLGLYGLLEHSDGLGLVVLDGNDGAFRLQCPLEHQRTAADLLGKTANQRVIGGDVGFAFAGVEKDTVHLADGGKGFYVGGECGAAHADNTGITDNLENGVGLQILVVHVPHHGFVVGVEIVVLDDDGEDVAAGGMGPGFHGQDAAGNGSMDGGADTGAVTDFLAAFDHVAHLNQRGTGRANVLNHGQYNLLGLQLRQIAAPGQGLVAFGVDATPEGFFHHVEFTS